MGLSIFHDTPFGHLIRFVTKGKYLKFPEEADPTIWTKAIDAEKSGYLAQHGSTTKPEDGVDLEGIGGVRTGGNQFEIQPPTSASSTTNGADELRKQKDSGDSERTEVNQASGVPVDAEKGGRDVHVVGWYGPNDPENPQNWPLMKKFFVSFEVCLLTTSVYIGSSIYTAGEINIMEIFGVGEVPATIGLTTFVAGYGIGPFLWAPMSEIPFIGRNPVYLGTLAVFVAFQAPTALAKNYGMLMAFRFLTGFFGSPVLATGGASLADIWAPAKRAYAIGIWGVAAVAGPSLGPLVGGYAVQYAPTGGDFTAPWTWPIWMLMWASAFCLVFLFFFFPETSSTNILVRRTMRLRRITGDDKLMCQPMLMAEGMTPKEVAMIAFVRPFTLNFLEPMVLLLNLWIALIYALLYTWFESFPDVFSGIYGFDESQLGLSYLGIFVGIIVPIPPFFWFLHRYVEPLFDENGNIQPEKRLPPSFVGAFCIPICLFWFGWTARADIHWIVPIIGSAFFSIGALLVFNCVLNYLPDAYPEYAASVLAGNDFMRSMVGAGFPTFAGALYHNLGIGWASSLLGFLGIAFIPIPFVLYKYGEVLRKNHSKHARKDI